jgi:hypothetical protein
MYRTAFSLIIALATPAILWQAATLAQAPSFDKLSAADRQAFQKRFEKEVWPLMTRNGKQGCVGCHSGKQVTALRLTGKLNKDFPMLIKEGFFLPDDAGSLLGRVTDPDKERRMPQDQAPWTKQEVEVLRAFVVDLDKKQQK